MKLPLTLFIICLVVLAGLLGYRFLLAPPSAHHLTSSAATAAPPAGQPPGRVGKLSAFESSLYGTLRKLEVAEEDIKLRPVAGDSLRRIRAAIPRGQPWEDILWKLNQCVNGSSYRVEDCVADEAKSIYTLRFTDASRRQPVVVLTLSAGERYFSTTARMAILIDKFNFEADQTTMEILSFPDPLTLSLLPSEKKSAWTSQAAIEYNKEIIIQLPLEPTTRVDSSLASALIMVHYPEEKIRAMVDASMRTIPNFSGFNNLLGSRACEDSRVMAIIMDLIARRNGYFVETPCSRNSTIPALARKAGVPYCEISASIADDASAAAVEDYLRHYCLLAQKRGKILVRVKARPAFVTALKNVRTYLAQNGVRLAYVSEIVSQPAEK
jgi:polysaccharide deacetylase 2 family uncharacterized protein YibQ